MRPFALRRRRRALAIVVVLGAGLAAAALSGSTRAGAGPNAESGAPSGVEHLHFEYGPLDIRPGQNVINTNKYRVPQPEGDGWIVGFKPNLRLANGKVPRVDVIHLHHGVWANATRRDKTAPLFPERFIAAGEEKTALKFPPGYGYPYRASEAWFLNYMIHDLTPKPYTVYLTYDVDFVATQDAPAGGMKDVHPIWLDVQNGTVYPVFDVL